MTPPFGKLWPACRQAQGLQARSVLSVCPRNRALSLKQADINRSEVDMTPSKAGPPLPSPTLRFPLTYKTAKKVGEDSKDSIANSRADNSYRDPKRTHFFWTKSKNVSARLRSRFVSLVLDREQDLPGKTGLFALLCQPFHVAICSCE